MKTIGLVGGTSWVSSADYYKSINEQVNQQLGGFNFAQCILYSFNFADIKTLTDRQDWATILKLVTEVCQNLTNAGAEGIILCANTMHLIAEELAKQLTIPIIHIAEATAEVIEQQGLKKVGLLGTKFTMERDFFKKKLLDRKIETIIPLESDREFMHTTIFEELGKDIFLESTKLRYLNIIGALVSQGAEGIVLGCTEIPLLIKQTDCATPLFDTLNIHVKAAVRYSLNL